MSGAVFADVTSANVVGYNNVARPSTTQINFCSGSMFNNIGGSGVTLADLKITGATTIKQCRNNYISFFKTGSAAILDPDNKYWMDLNGDWRQRDDTTDPADDPIVTKEDAAKIHINEGEGVLCTFNNACALNYNGEVITGGIEKKLAITRPSTTQVNFVVVNPSGSTINLGQISISGLSTAKQCRNNYISFFKTGSATILDPNNKYWMDLSGNWRQRDDSTSPDDDPIVSKDDLEKILIRAGEGFLCTFNNAATIKFPTAL